MKLDLDAIRAEKEAAMPRQLKTFVSEEHFARLRHAAHKANVPMYRIVAELIENYLPEVSA